MKKDTAASTIQSELSIERTKMANRRTLLSYVRSAVGLLVAGVGLLKFIQVQLWIYIGWICIILTPVLLVVGIFDYIKVKKLILKESQYLDEYLSDEDSEE